VSLQRGPLNLVKIIEGQHESKSSGSGQENRINGRGDPLRWPRDTLYPQKLALTLPTSGGRSVGVVCLRTKGHGGFLYLWLVTYRQLNFTSPVPVVPQVSGLLGWSAVWRCW
jgi:hypothetical protein